MNQSSGIANIRGAQISFSSDGSGPLTLLAHGLTSSRASEDRAGRFDWAPIVASGRRLVRYDARGHGRSSGELDEESYNWANLALDVLDLIDLVAYEESGRDRTPVSAIGASMGTATILHAAVHAPERFDRLVLTCPPTAWETRAAQAGLYRDGADFAETNGKEAYADRANALPRLEVFAGLPEIRRVPDIAEDLLPTVLRGAAGSNLPDPEAIAALTQPTLVLAWAGDPGHPVSSAYRLGELMPGATVEIANDTDELLTWGARTAEFLSS